MEKIFFDRVNMLIPYLLVNIIKNHHPQRQELGHSIILKCN